MFDDHARQLLERLPNLAGLDIAECRRALSAAYTQIVERRLQGHNGTPIDENTQRMLRRMIDALESVAVFDPLAGIVTQEDTLSASAFAAAEALSLLTENTPDTTAAEGLDAIQQPANYRQIETALLYLIGGYDINASTSAKGLPDYVSGGGNALVAATAQNASYLVERIKALCRGDVRPPALAVPFTGFDVAPTDGDTLILECRLRCYEILAKGVNSYLQWLRTGDHGLRDASLNGIEKVRSASHRSEHPGFTDLADIYHLASLLLWAVRRTSVRSVLDRVPVPATEDETRRNEFRQYLVARVTGTHGWRGRPFLWPSAQDFVAQCLPGPRADAVVAMPTGSGKSFVAELAIADALTRGSVIYLAPTNALVHQIRQDLKDAFGPFSDVEILAFLGGDEYSAGFDNFLGVGGPRFVAVMTPEKCALALRLSPGAFTDLQFCVFDECHLLGEPSRGVIVDLLLAQLFTAAPQMNFLLMSAMISNPEELRDWLAAARGAVAVQCVVKWRPSRTLRGVVGIDRTVAQQNYDARLMELATLQEIQPHRVRLPFEAPLMMLASLSGPWSSPVQNDYRAASLPGAADFSVLRRNGAASFSASGWCNDATLEVAQLLARAKIPTIAFVLQNRNWAFSMAAQVNPPLRDATLPLPVLAQAYLKLAEAELGVASDLETLFARGVAVHTSLMLSVEQSAAELMFRDGFARLMFATPTLAQGLNLPAVAVVIGGTSLGGGRWGQGADANLAERTKATILNSFGRAGRPGFSNQGVALLIPDQPVRIKSLADALTVRNTYPVLTSVDAAVAIRSPIEQFLDRVLFVAGNQLAATQVELELVTSLAESPAEDDAACILRRTFGGYRRRANFTEQVADTVRDRIAQLKTEFIAQANIPAWLNLAASQAGVDLFRARQLWVAFQLRGVVSVEEAVKFTVENWFGLLIGILSELPPARLNFYLEFKLALTAGDVAEPSTLFDEMRNAVNDQRATDSFPWAKPPGWEEKWINLNAFVWSYMRGESLAELHPRLRVDKNLPFESGRGQGKPIPKLLNALKDVTEALARDAGCIVALYEQAMQETLGDAYKVPEALAALPLCIRNGCDSLKTLAIFRIVYRQRMFAHRMSAYFNMPADITTEGQRADWARSIRLAWLQDEYAVLDNDAILLAGKLVLRRTMP
jgi:hypothetical protein